MLARAGSPMSAATWAILGPVSMCFSYPRRGRSAKHEYFGQDRSVSARLVRSPDIGCLDADKPSESSAAIGERYRPPAAANIRLVSNDDRKTGFSEPPNSHRQLSVINANNFA